MSGKCPGCGATSAPEARFCRRCGAPLKARGADTAAQVSPVAQTVPLADEGRATDGLAAEESQRLGEGTSRIKRAEMDELLRRIARDHGDTLTRDQDGSDGLSLSPKLADGDGSSKAAPVTSGLKAGNAELAASASLPHTESGPVSQAESDGGAPQTETASSSSDATPRSLHQRFVPASVGAGLRPVFSA